MYNKIMFQAGPTGGVPNWGKFVREMSAKGLPVFAAVTDTRAVYDDILAHGAAGSRVNWRPTEGPLPHEMRTFAPEWQDHWGQGKENRYQIDRPDLNYYKTKQAAIESYQRGADYHIRAVLIRAKQFGVDTKHPFVSIKTWNEVRNKQEHEGKDEPPPAGFADWFDSMGWQAYYIGKELVRRKATGQPWFRWSAFGFAGGNPHVAGWETEGMLKFLRLCAEYPDVLGICLHEYSFTHDIWRGFEQRDFIGRFERLFAVCDKHGIKRPCVEIAEWGWEEADIPDHDIAIQHIKEVSAYYASFPEIKLAAIWTTRKWHGNAGIHEKVQGLASALYDFSLSFDAIEAQPPTEPPLTSGNLLLNGDFEADWGEERSHDALIIRTDGSTKEIEVGNIFTPPYWLTYFYHDEGELAQPEVRDARHRERVADGEKGQVLFTFFKRHHGGFLQRVPTTKGERLTFAALAHAWSNHQDPSKPDQFPHPDDPKWSEGVGYGGSFILEGDTSDDAERNFTFRLGVDPTGGVDPTADSVVWGQGAHIYNEYHAVPAVTTTAAGGQATVFMESRTLWPYKHNDAYWDGAVLITEKAEQPPVEPPTEPPVKRKVVVNLIPQDATIEQSSSVLQAAYPKRQTMTFSPEDAVYLLTAGNGESSLIEWKFDDDKTAGNPLDGLRLGPLLGVPFQVTSRFNDPRSYGNGLHEGVDLDELAQSADSKTPILCPYDGVVTRARKTNSRGEPSAYGWHYIIESKNKGGTFFQWVAHCDKLFFKVGDLVKKGQPIAELGGYGETGKGRFAEHVHYNLQVPGYGLKGYVVNDVVDPLPYFDNEQPIKYYAYTTARNGLRLRAEPSSGGKILDVMPFNTRVAVYEDTTRWYKVRYNGVVGYTWNGYLRKEQTDTIDLLPYLRGDDKRHYELRYTWKGGGTHPTQSQWGADGVFYIVKGHSGEYEKLWHDDDWIYRGEDTSEAPDKFYVQTTNGRYGAMWCKRHMAIGERVQRDPFVKHYYKDCRPRKEGTHISGLTLQKRHDSYTFESGIKLDDVIEMTWDSGERYWFAKGWGLVGFEYPEGKSWISEVHKGRRDLQRNQVKCLPLVNGERFYL